MYPALILNYFGQGALLLLKGSSVVINPFFGMVSSFWVLPLSILATFATIIASQALISGAFSIGQQTIQLGYSPRMTILHTSSTTHGQIYIPEMNAFLMVGCCSLVILFKNSSNLASAYGIAVMGTMTLTSLLFFQVMRYVWKWKPLACFCVTLLFLFIDGVFLFSNLGTHFCLQNLWHMCRTFRIGGSDEEDSFASTLSIG